MKWSKCLVLSGFWFLSWAAVNAQNRSTVLQLDEAGNADEIRFNMDIVTSFETNLYEFDNENDKRYSNTTFLFPRINMNDYLIGMFLIHQKELSDLREEKLLDPRIIVMHPTFNWGNGFLYRTAFQLFLPLGEDSRDLTDLYAGFRVEPRFIYIPQQIKGLTFIYRPNATVNFHEFELRRDGLSNTQYGLTQRLTIDYNIWKNLSITFDNIYSRGITYQGNSNDNFSFDQSISYFFPSGFNVALGHSIGGNVLSENGIDYDIRLFDENDSTVYTSFGFSY